MYEAVRAERLRREQEALNAHPLLPEVSKGMDITLSECITDRPFGLFIHAVDGRIVEFTEEKKPTDVTFEAPFDTWRRIYLGELDFLKAIMRREIKYRIVLDLNKNPGLAVLKGVKASMSFQTTEAGVAFVMRMLGDSFEAEVREVKIGERLAEFTFETPMDFLEKIVFGEMTELVKNVLLRRIKLKGGIGTFIKALKLRKLTPLMYRLKFARLFQEFVRWHPLVEMA